MKPISVRKKHCTLNEGFRLAIVALRFGSVDYQRNIHAVPKVSVA